MGITKAAQTAGPGRRVLSLSLGRTKQAETEPKPRKSSLRLPFLSVKKTMPGSSQLSAAGSSVSLAVAESQDTLAPALSIDRLEDIVDLDFGLRRAATAPSGGLPAVEIQGQAFYEPSVAAKAQARQDRLAAGRPMGGEDWGDDFEDLSDGSTVDDDGGPGFRLKLSEDVAKRQEQVRRDAENMRSFAHHIEGTMSKPPSIQMLGFSSLISDPRPSFPAPARKGPFFVRLVADTNQCGRKGFPTIPTVPR